MSIAGCDAGENHEVDQHAEETEQDATEETIVLLGDAAVKEYAMVVHVDNTDAAVRAMIYLFGQR